MISRSLVIHSTYWLIWLTTVVAWFQLNAAGSPDHRIYIYFIGLLVIGALSFILLPVASLFRFPLAGHAYRSGRRFMVGVCLWGLGSVVFLTIAHLYEITLQGLIREVEANDLPLLREMVATSIIWAALGYIVGLCGVNSSNRWLQNSVGFTIAVASLLIGVALLFFGQP